MGQSSTWFNTCLVAVRFIRGAQHSDTVMYSFYTDFVLELVACVLAQAQKSWCVYYFSLTFAAVMLLLMFSESLLAQAVILVSTELKLILFLVFASSGLET